MQPVYTKLHFYFPERISKFPLGCKKKKKWGPEMDFVQRELQSGSDSVLWLWHPV